MINRKGNNVQRPENEVWEMSGSFDTNSTSAPDGVTKSLTGVTRTGVGTFEVEFKSWGKSLFDIKVGAISAVGTRASVKSETFTTDGKLILELRAGGAVKAGGTITCTAQANYVDGENMAVITNEYGVVTTFEADPAADGATAGSIAVDISGDTSAIDVAATLTPLINTNCPWLTATAVGDGTITLSHDRAGASGNAVTITENVVNAGHIVPATLTGGVDGDNTLVDTNNEKVWIEVVNRRSSVESR